MSPPSTDMSFDQAPCGLVVCDGNGAIIRANAYFCDMSGYADGVVRTFGRCLTRPSQFIFNAKVLPQLNTMGVAREIALTVAGPDGAGVAVLVNVSKIVSDAGAVEYHYAVLPARERREYEQEYLQAKAQLTQYRDYLQMAEKLVHVGHWHVSLATRACYWSPEIYAILGCDPKTFKPVLGSHEALLHPDDRAASQAIVAAAIASGEAFTFQTRAVRADTGEIRTVSCSGVCERDATGRVTGLFGVFKDQTESLRAQEQLAQSEARYRLLADNASDVITVTDVTGRIEYISPSVEHVLGFPPEDFIGKTVRSFVMAEDYPAVAAAYRAYAAGGKWDDAPHIRYRILNRDGREVWLEAHPKAILGDDGQVLRFQDVVRDITEQKATEDALAQATVEANAAADAKAQFLATMSHELRTPLTSIIGFSSLLRDLLVENEQHRRYSHRIWAAGQGLLSLINDILDHSKLDAGHLELDLAPCAVGELARDVVDLLSIQAEAKGIALRLTGDLSGELMLDEVRMRQILLNLIGNAVKFTESGSVTVALNQGSAKGKSHLRVSVKDTGVGISPEGQKALFQRFSQVDHSVGGTGLGLLICKQLVELMGGRIAVASRPGEGSEFWFEIPVASCVQTVAATPDWLGEDARLGQVLVADDHAASLDVVSVLLRSQGYSVDTAHNGAEALQACIERRYDLILMDVAMPVMDGLLAARGIRSSSELNARTPIIGLTAGGGDRRLDCLAAGMCDLVAKPILPATLLLTVSSWLRDGETDNALRKETAR